MKQHKIFIITAILFLVAGAAAQKPTPVPAPQVDVWTDDFSGGSLDETKWEKFTFEGASGGKLEVRDGEVRIRSAAKTRAGIRSKQTFSGDRWIVEAALAKVGAGFPESERRTV